ncbi:MAG: NADH-quinone oxidoreductase subunit J, partial [Chloroflexota bacterium]
QQPMLRVINATPDFPEADIYLNGELFAADVPFGTTDEGEVASFETVQPGEYSLSIAEAGSEGRPLPLGTFDIEGGESLTVVTYGIIGTDIRPSLVAIDEDITYFDDQGGRLIVLNVYDDLPLRVVDAGTDRIFTADEATDAPVIYESLLLGEPTEQTVVRAGNKDWVFTPAIAEGVAPSRVDEIIVRPPPSFGVEEGVSNLMIVARDRDGESFLPVLLPVVTEVLPQFGSPEAIGNVLFVVYVFQFELVAVLLLAAMVGAIVLTQRPQVRPKPGRPTRRKVSRPLTSVIATQTGHSISVEEPPRAVTKTEPDSETSEPTGD